MEDLKDLLKDLVEALRRKYPSSFKKLPYNLQTVDNFRVQFECSSWIGNIISIPFEKLPLHLDNKDATIDTTWYSTIISWRLKVGK